MDDWLRGRSYVEMTVLEKEAVESGETIIKGVGLRWYTGFCRGEDGFQSGLPDHQRRREYHTKHETNETRV